MRVRDNFAGREPKWKVRGAKKAGDHFECAVKKGDVVEATLAKPAAIPPAPPNLAEPVVLSKASGIMPNPLPR